MNTSQDELEYFKDDAKPFYFEGSSNKIGILLTHGFTASPTEMLPLGQYLHRKGFTVHGIQLAGHGTNYWELPNYSYKDWINSIDEGLSLLTEKCETIIPIGIKSRVEEAKLSQAVVYFPLIGILLGLILTGVNVFLSSIFGFLTLKKRMPR